MQALEKNNTWNVVDFPGGKELIGYIWVFSVKLQPNGTIQQYKVRLVTKGYT